MSSQMLPRNLVMIVEEEIGENHLKNLYLKNWVLSNDVAPAPSGTLLTLSMLDLKDLQTTQ